MSVPPVDVVTNHVSAVLFTTEATTFPILHLLHPKTTSSAELVLKSLLTYRLNILREREIVEPGQNLQKIISLCLIPENYTK